MGQEAIPQLLKPVLSSKHAIGLELWQPACAVDMYLEISLGLTHGSWEGLEFLAQGKDLTECFVVLVLSPDASALC
eukprot:514320-Pelagomonas_calceolata.AAC.4